MSLVPVTLEIMLITKLFMPLFLALMGMYILFCHIITMLITLWTSGPTQIDLEETLAKYTTSTSSASSLADAQYNGQLYVNTLNPLRIVSESFVSTPKVQTMAEENETNEKEEVTRLDNAIVYQSQAHEPSSSFLAVPSTFKQNPSDTGESTDTAPALIIVYPENQTTETLFQPSLKTSACCETGKQTTIDIKNKEQKTEKKLEQTFAKPEQEIEFTSFSSRTESQTESILKLRQEPRNKLFQELKVIPELETNLELEIKSELGSEFNPIHELAPNEELERELIPDLESEHESKLKLQSISTHQPTSELDTQPEIGSDVSIYDEKVTNPHSNETDDLCKEENAYYATHYECDTFIACKKYVPKKYVCPDGLLFNNKATWPEYPCSYPFKVMCSNNKSKRTQALKPIGKCSSRYGTFPSIKGDCGKYIVCEDGRALHMTCPKGLAFNPRIGGCDWPENVPDCNPKVFGDFTCPEPPKDIYGRLSEKVHSYRHKNSCKEYIACYKGEPRLLRCDSGLSFDEFSGYCINSKAVKNCRN